MILADIRFCEKEDVGQVLEVDRTAPYPWPESVISRDLGAGDIDVFPLPGLSYLGAFARSQNKLLGYAVLGDEKGNGILMNLVVVPAYRRWGLGSQLVVAVAECAWDMGFPALVLRARASNFAALTLYRGLGFETDVVSGTQEDFYSDGDKVQYMRLKLPLTLLDTDLTAE